MSIVEIGKSQFQKKNLKLLKCGNIAKGQLIMAHYKWIKSILNQMKEIKMGLKGYKYLDEMIELGTELGLNISVRQNLSDVILVVL